METLRIRLFGELELRLGEAPLPALESARAESLLAYLLLHRDAPVPRQRLAFVLWPDSTEPQARTNLRHVLHNLRRALPGADGFLEITPRTLRWRPDAPFRLDVAEFEAALGRSDGDPVAALREAVEAYGGDLLEGSYDDWVRDERERLRERHVEALDRLAALLAERGEHAEAIRHAERLLRHDALREETYRLLMRLHEARGDRARALRAYHACAAELERELGIEPSAPTRAAYEALLPAHEQAAAALAALGGPALVGRGPERTRLAQLWRATERGRAQLVLVTGEAGIGKTRLLEELRSWCAQLGAVTAEARSYPAEGALAYGPVVAWLRSEPLAARRRRLDGGRLAELARVLPELDLPLPEPLPEGEQRQRLFDALAAAVLAPGAPLLLLADDLHWADPETLRFLHYLVRTAPDARLLVAATARREEIGAGHPLDELATALGALERCVEIEVGRLSPRETAVLAERVAGGPLEPAAAKRLFAGTEGNPLFVVEALRAGWAGGGGALSPRVQAVIEARLAALSPAARELAGIAAAIGREFTADVLAQASGAGEEELVRALDELWRRRIVRDRGPDAYDFTHGRIREVAYRAVAPARRRRTHLLVAQALERLHADQPAGVAAHYERAGSADSAVSWYARAAEGAQQLPAAGDALRLLERARRLVATLPDGSGREARELALVTAELAPLAIVDGFSGTRLAERQRRGHELARALRIEPEPPLLRSVAMTALAAGDFDRSRDFAGRLRGRAERDADGVGLVESDYVLGVSAFWQGELAAARRHFEAAVDRYRPRHRSTHLVRYGLDPAVVCMSRLGNTLWFLGRPRAAARARDSALALATEVVHPATASTARVFAALLALELGDADGVREQVATLAASEREREVRVIQVKLPALSGYVDVLDGRWESGLGRIRDALEQAQRMEHAPGLSASVARLLAAACVVAGDPCAGLAAADSLLESAVGLWDAEALRLRAEFRAATSAPGSEVRAELERALRIARRQDARSLELRVATSLLRHGGEHDAAALAAVVAGLPEDSETPDRRAAAGLLARGTLAERTARNPAEP
jgi:DNA-binding SARP family transcriptional activator